VKIGCAHRNSPARRWSSWLLTAALHLLFHATHLDNFGSGDAIAEIASLALLVIPPPVAIWAVR
jgi:hypothetical protein